MPRTENLDIIIRARDAASPALTKVIGGLKLMGAVAGIATAAAIGVKLVAAIRSAITVTAEFEKTLSKVEAITRATGKQMGALSDQAKELGRTTVFTASQAAEAQANFALAGFKVKEILDALPGTLDLAAAGELGLADAASITSNALRQFQLDAGQAVDVADLLAKTASNSNQTVNDLGEALKFAGPAAQTLGVSITETSAALAILANAGLKATIGGTALRKTFTTFLGQLEEGQEGLGRVADQLFDQEGRFIGLAEAVRVMSEAGIKAGDAFAIFGDRAGSAMAILLTLGPEALEKMETLLEDRLGFAADVAAIKLNNLSGDVTRLKSASEGLQIAVGEKATPALRVLVRTVTEVINILTEAESGGAGLGDAVAAAAQLATTTLIQVVLMVQRLRIAFTAVRGAVQLFGAVAAETLTQLAIQLALFLDSINFTGAFDNLLASMVELTKQGAVLAAGFRDQATESIENIGKLEEQYKDLEARLKTVPVELAKLARAEEELAKIEKELAGKILEAKVGLQGFNEVAAGFNLEPITGQVKTAAQRFDELREKIEESREAMLEAYGTESGEQQQEFWDLTNQLLDQNSEAEARRANAIKAANEQAKASQQQQARTQKVMESLTRSVVANFQAWVEGSVSAIQAVKNIVSGVLNSIAQQVLVQAAQQIADALADTAAGLYTQAAQHYQAAAKYTAVGALAAGAAAVVRKQQGGIVPGIGSTDRIPALLTPGEGVLTAGQTQAILGGGAAVVPLSRTGDDFDEVDPKMPDLSGLRNTVLDGDKVERWAARNFRGLMGGMRMAQVRGF